MKTDGAQIHMGRAAQGLGDRIAHAQHGGDIGMRLHAAVYPVTVKPWSSPAIQGVTATGDAPVECSSQMRTLPGQAGLRGVGLGGRI